MDEFEEYNFNSSSLGRVILHIKKMCKKPSIEAGLSESLDLFVQKLNESDKYLENGIFNTNFTEAALFVQSAAELYGKKVDLLWDGILDYQKRMILYEAKQKNEEIDKLEERINRYRRKKTLILRNQGEVNPAVSLFKETDIKDLNIESHNIERMPIKWNLPRIDRTEFRTRESDIFEMAQDHSHSDNFPIYDDDEDELYDEPNITLKRWHGLDIMKLIIHLYDKNFVNDLSDSITKIRTDIDLVYDYRIEHDIPPEVPREQFENELQKYVQSCVISRRTNISPELEVIRKNLCPAETIINLQRLPNLLVNEKLRRISVLDAKAHPPDITDIETSSSGGSDCDIQINSHKLDKPDILEPNNIEATEKKIRQDSGYFDLSGDNIDSCEFLAGTPDPSTAKDVAMEVEPATTIAVEPATTMEVDTVTNLTEDLRDDVETERINSSVISVTGKKVQDNKLETEKEKNSTKLLAAQEPKESCRKKRELQEDPESPSKRRKLSKRQIEKLAVPIKLVNMSKFEKFYFLNYNPATDEGKVPDFYDLSDDDSDMETEEFLGFPTTTTTAVNECDLDNTDFAIEDNHLDTSKTDDVISASQDSGIGSEILDDSEVPSCSMSTQVSTNETACDDSIPIAEKLPPKKLTGPTKADIQQSKENVKNWKASIIPKLRALTNSEFDIHKYGSDIMEPMQINEVKMFKDIVQGKPSPEVVRYFISSLQLANTYNVKIGGVRKGQLSNESFYLKLLSKDRYHDHLKEYEAPSEESFRERLHRMQQNSSVSLHSTPLKKKFKMSKD